MSNKDKQQTVIAKTTHFVESVFEHFLWNSRAVIIIAVIGLMVCAIIAFLVGIFETYNLVSLFITHLIHYGTHLDEIYSEIILGVITIVDDFLLGIVLLIFSFGTYDLFISRLDPASVEDDIRRPDWMVFNSLDELKSILGKVILMIMIINFLKFTVGTHFEEPIHLLYLGGGIALIAFAMKLSHGEDINETTIPDRFFLPHEGNEQDHLDE